MKRLRLIATIVLVVLIAVGPYPVKGAAASSTHADQIIDKPQQLTDQPPEGKITTQGVKSKAVVKVATLLRAGGDEVIYAAKRFHIIDSSTARTFKHNSKKIGDWLTKFENAGKKAAGDVRKQLPIYLKENTKMSNSTAENISVAVSWAIRGADILFL
ncbi:hypothetical protein ACFFGV_04085 [Pontibacillus salicampi]|uniref:Uncharacterized protein n=1 Tax=Pontibacillus salicampi TaxID=1449801 RepID=A0ABV6LK86_9BACI